MKRNLIYVISILGFCLFAQSANATVAGRFQFVAGDVKVVSAEGKERAAQKGAEISQGETIRTRTASSAQIKMLDDGLIVVRPETELKVTTFIYTGKADGSERSLLSLFKGGFRAITGMIGHVNKEHYKIQTPTATIGIRGTDHEPTFIPDPLPGQVARGEPGTYDKVNSGAAVISTAKGMVVVNPAQAGFVPNIPNVMPKLLDRVPAFYQAVPDKNEPVVSQQNNSTAPNGGGTTGQGAAIQTGTNPATASNGTATGTSSDSGAVAVLPAKSTASTALTPTTLVTGGTAILKGGLVSATPVIGVANPALSSAGTLTSGASVSTVPTPVVSTISTGALVGVKTSIGATLPTTITPVAPALITPIAPSVLSPVVMPTNTLPLITPAAPAVAVPSVLMPSKLPLVTMPPVVAPPMVTMPSAVAPPVIAPIAPQVIAPIAPLVIAPIAPPVIAPIAPPVIAPIAPPVIAPIAPLVIAPIAPPVIAPIAPPVIAPIAPPIIAPIAPPVIAPIAPPIIAPIAPPVIAPIAPTVISPIINLPIKPIGISDRRLKMNIKRIGTHHLGIGIYEFDYVWGEHAIGVMADEVKLVRPEAVIHRPDGYDMVDYSKLD